MTDYKRVATTVDGVEVLEARRAPEPRMPAITGRVRARWSTAETMLRMLAEAQFVCVLDVEVES